MTFATTVSQRPPWMVLQLEGELDLLSSSLIADVMGSAMDAGADRLVLDLTNLTFVDTAGVEGIVRMCGRAERTGVDVVVTNVSLLAAKVLEVSGVTNIIHAPTVLAS